MDTIKLIEQLPNRYGAPQKIADRLNQRHILTPYGRQYTVQNVRNSLNSEHIDNNVILEFVALVKEHRAEKLAIAKKVESVLSI